MIKDFKTVLAESTCQKRKTVCELYDVVGNLLARESNRCEPEGGVCYRLGVVQNKANYDTSSNCNWTHCEMNALKNLPKGAKPHKAVLYGHNFYCDKCETALKLAGIKIFEIKK